MQCVKWLLASPRFLEIHVRRSLLDLRSYWTTNAIIKAVREKGWGGMVHSGCMTTTCVNRPAPTQNDLLALIFQIKSLYSGSYLFYKCYIQIFLLFMLSILFWSASTVTKLFSSYQSYFQFEWHKLSNVQRTSYEFHECKDYKYSSFDFQMHPWSS